MNQFRRLLVPCLVLAMVLIAVHAATACPTCKLALASQDRSHGDLVGGFFWSILFMMAMPFTILAVMGTYMYLLVRRDRAQRAAAERDRRQVATTAKDPEHDTIEV